jgi:hypothetical protein
MTREHNIGPLADALGEVRMKISALQFEEKQIKTQLAEFGIGSYVGREFVALVEQYWRSDLDLAAVRKKLGAAWCKQNSTERQVTAVRCVARRDLQARTLRARA